MTTVVVPWRPGCPWRGRALDLARSWWGAFHPDWTLLVVGDSGAGPWRKGVAVWEGLRGLPDGETVVVCDADVLPFGVTAGVELVRSGAGWAAPFSEVRRLTRDATETLSVPPYLAAARTLPAKRVYRGYPGGGCVVLPAATARSVPMDPRFAGWGQEDHSWNLALCALVGGPRRVNAPLIHLWHPRAPRLSRGVGSVESRDLWRRYQRAATRPLMRALVDESVEWLYHPPCSDLAAVVG